MHSLRQLARRALVSLSHEAAMHAATPRSLCGPLLACRTPAVATAAAARHPVFGAGTLRVSTFCPGSRALLHARARPVVAHRTAVAPRKPRAQAVGFEETGLAPELLEAAEALGLKTATEIQVQAIPEIMKGGHVVMASHTGSGKTLAFLLPVVHCIRRDEAVTGERVKPKRPRAVVLEPTRELAQQVLGVCKAVCHHARFSSALISGGGEKMQLQRETLATPRDVLVGTPGRLLQLLREGAWYAGDVRFLVVDEADTLLDKGFGPEVEALLAPVLATGGQAVLVSATMTKAVEALVATLLPDARRVATSSLHRAVAGARHRFLPVPGDSDKMDVLRSLLATEGGAASKTRTMVFCNTLPSCRAAEHALAEAGLNTVSYNGDMAGEARVESVRAFTAGMASGDVEPPPIMVCTDIAARGLDFGCSVGHVIMFDFPLNPVDYLHRTGRTARAGKGGRITSLITKRDRVLADQIEANIRTGAALDALSSSKAKVDALKRAAVAAKPPRAGAGATARRYGAGPPGRRTGAASSARGTRGGARTGAPSGASAGKRTGPPSAAGKKAGPPASKFSKFTKPSLVEQDAQFAELRGMCGASSGELKLDEGAFGRGLFLPAGARCAEVLLSVPLGWALVVRGDLDNVDPDAILQSRVYQLHKQWEAQTGATLPEELLIMIDSAFPAEQRLAFWLLYAIKNGGPLWQRLGALLPDPDECPSPLLWRDADLSELQDVAFSMQLSAARQTAARGYEGFLEAWPLGKQLHAALGHPTAQDFVWALAMVQSRGMADELPAAAEGGSPERVAMLVPFADMANHIAYEPGFSGAVDDSGDAFSLTCCRVDGVPSGGELTVSYRDGASNLELMRKYGFVTPRNPNDWFMFSSRNPAQVRDMALDRARLEPLVRAAAKADSLVPGYLPALLASLPAMPGEEAQRSTLADQAARAAALHAALLEEQAVFVTSLEEDEALLARGGLGMRLEAAVLFRRERKRLLRAAAEAVQLYAVMASRVVAKASAAAPGS